MMQEITSEYVNDICRRYLSLFQDWCRYVPNMLIQHFPKPESSCARTKLLYFLVKRWEKLHQDLNGALVLLHSRHIGPAVVLSRVVRENALQMVACAFDAPSEDESNLYYFNNVCNQKNARLLKNHCKDLRDINGLDPLVHDRINKSEAYADSILDSVPSTIPPQSKFEGKGFRPLTKVSADLLTSVGFDSSTLVYSVLQYWIECEAVHNGPQVDHLYKPLYQTGDIELDVELSILSGIRDLYHAKVMVTASLLQAGGLVGKVSLPEIAKDLSTIASLGEQVLHHYAQGGSNAAN